LKRKEKNNQSTNRSTLKRQFLVKKKNTQKTQKNAQKQGGQTNKKVITKIIYNVSSQLTLTTAYAKLR